MVLEDDKGAVKAAQPFDEPRAELAPAHATKAHAVALECHVKLDDVQEEP